MTLLDSIFAHDVEDAVSDGIPVPPAPGEPSHSQSSKESALGIRTGPCLHPEWIFKHGCSCVDKSALMQLHSTFRLQR